MSLITKADLDKIRDEAHHVVGSMARQSRSLQAPCRDVTLVARLDAWLDLLAQVNIAPELKTDARAFSALQTIWDEDRGMFFSEDHRRKAKTLFNKFEAANWGHSPEMQDNGAQAPVVPLKVVQSAQPDRDLIRRQAAPSTGSSSSTPRAVKNTGMPGDLHSIKRPPHAHPIWGVQGVMHGLAYTVTRRDGHKARVLNPEFIHEKTCPKIYGHNGLAVGQWFPYLLVALHRGCHGAAQAGIHGDARNGAFSIVVSGQYDLLDRDLGDTLYYSGSGSHANKDPHHPAAPTNATLGLRASLQSCNPVRVLRSSSARGPFAPRVGIRYDGLYQVIAAHLSRNQHGGRYEQFKLVRCADQPSLDQCLARPSHLERREFDRINDGY